MSTSKLIFACIFVLFICSCNNEPTTPPVDEARAWKHIIPARTGDKYIKSYRAVADTLKIKDFELVNHETFDRNAIALLLNQKETDGLRIYMGRNEANKVIMVLVPVDKNGKDIRKVLLKRTDTTGEQPRSAKSAEADDTDPGEQFVEVGQRQP